MLETYQGGVETTTAAAQNPWCRWADACARLQAAGCYSYGPHCAFPFKGAKHLTILHVICIITGTALGSCTGLGNGSHAKGCSPCWLVTRQLFQYFMWNAELHWRGRHRLHLFEAEIWQMHPAAAPQHHRDVCLQLHAGQRHSGHGCRANNLRIPSNRNDPSRVVSRATWEHPTCITAAAGGRFWHVAACVKTDICT